MVYWWRAPMTLLKLVTRSRVAGPAAVSVGRFGYFFALEKVTRTQASAVRNRFLIQRTCSLIPIKSPLLHYEKIASRESLNQRE